MKMMTGELPEKMPEIASYMHLVTVALEATSFAQTMYLSIFPPSKESRGS